MGGKKEESKKKYSQDFDLDKELSSYVEKKVIPSRVADKLKEKINEKNVKINRNQLEKLVFKIQDALNNYIENRDNVDVESSSVGNEMDVLMEKIEKIQGRLEEIENGLFEDEDGSSFVTTDDIKVPGKKTDVDSVKLNPLSSIPDDPESVIVVMKWLQFLVDKCGRDNLPEVLDYYVDIGWMTDDAKIDLLDYSNGITDGKSKEEKSNKVPELPSKDHIQSLVFIQRLRGNKFDKHFVEKVEGEISRLTKKLDNYKFK